MPYNCTVVRCKKVTTHTLGLATGRRGPAREEWVTEPCGAPLFGDIQQAAGMCRACASGWTHPDNYPVTC